MEDAGHSAEQESFELADDDPRYGAPDELTAIPMDPKLDLLPTNLMAWPNFEKLLLRIAREVYGLRSVRLFGNPGQTQYGLDGIGISPEGSAEGIQGKKYSEFKLADLNAAVKKFVENRLSDSIGKLYVGVSCTATERKVTEKLIELNRVEDGLTVVLWDQITISDVLRSRPEIVIEFFGEEAARRFCLPFRLDEISVPSRDLVGLANAVLRGPLIECGAQDLVLQAQSIQDSDPKSALTLIVRAQGLLRDRGFEAHAVQLDQDVTRLLQQDHRSKEASSLLLQQTWDALRDDQIIDAGHYATCIEDLKRSERGEQSLDDATDESLRTGTDDQMLRSIARDARLARDALYVYQSPLGEIPDLTDRAYIDDPLDFSRLLLLTAETAYADGNYSWIERHFTLIKEVAALVASLNEEVFIRLELVVADFTNEWATVLGLARRRQIDRKLSAIVLARHARSLAEHGEFESADVSWPEAVDQGCLVGSNLDAAEWLYSLDLLATRYNGFSVDSRYLSLASSLIATGRRTRIIAADMMFERALHALHRNESRSAAQRLRRYLRDAIVGGSWREEFNARQLLGEMYSKSGELALAADHLIVSSDIKELEIVADRAGDRYIEVIRHLDSPKYWVVAATLRFIARQADLVPDSEVGQIVASSLSICDRQAAGTLKDGGIGSPSVYFASLRALAALSDRLSADQATNLLAHLAPLAITEPGRYRHTDEDHISICVNIAQCHEGLAASAIDQLMQMLDRDITGRAHHAMAEAMETHSDRVRPQLQALADKGNHGAINLLIRNHGLEAAGEGPSAQEAARLLCAPLPHSYQRYSTTHGVVEQSIRALGLGPTVRAQIIEAQLDRVRSPYESAHNRIEYLHAAANLTEGLDATDADRLFYRAIMETRESARSEADDHEDSLRSPFGSTRILYERQDSRTAAALLAAALARTQTQRSEARNAALRLIGKDPDVDWDVARALQLLKEDLEDDVPYLASLSWTFRSLAALAWAESGSLDPTIGEGLARDPEFKVRQTLASALARQSRTERTAGTREILEKDPRYSVRKMLIEPLNRL